MEEQELRIFDDLPPNEQLSVLVTCIRYAKGEISALNLPPTTDVIELAVQYDTMYFLEPDDFVGLNLTLYTAFIGRRPEKRP